MVRYQKNKFQLEVQAPFLPKLPNRLLRQHHTKITAEKNLVYGMMQVALGGKPRPKCALLAAKLTLIRHSSQKPDWDGLVGSFKFVIDYLVHCKILNNDDPDTIGESKCLWEKVKPNEGFIQVIIAET